MNYSHHSLKDTPMTTAEKISIALPPEMVHIVRDALRDWTYKRDLRQQGIAGLRQAWQEALNDKTSGISPDEVLDRLERKYKTIADAAGTEK